MLERSSKLKGVTAPYCCIQSTHSAAARSDPRRVENWSLDCSRLEATVLPAERASAISWLYWSYRSSTRLLK